MGRYQAAAHQGHDTDCMCQESSFPFQTSLSLDFVPDIIVVPRYYLIMKGMLRFGYVMKSVIDDCPAEY